ncbi:MAG: YdcF family protein [Erysipelotrichaceae bacterium]|nr:YdcF family protein [Erysipelotrichaceae bacterium]
MLRFFTIDEKPRLHYIGIVTAAVSVFIFFMLKQEPVNHRLILDVVIAYLLLCVVSLVYAFIRQLKYNPYSYNSIYYIGFALFLFVTSLIQIISVRYLRGAALDDEIILLSAMSKVVSSGKTYMLLSFPLVLIFSIGLCISNISLIRHEGFSLTNVLGIILSFLLVGGDLFLFFSDYYTSGSMYEVMIHDMLVNLYAAIYLYFECMLIGAIIVNIIVNRYVPDKDKDFIIVLGCGLLPDGTPTPLLASRIEKALSFHDEQKEKTGKSPMFITSGGQGPDEAVPESTAMKRYLVEKGIPEDLIIEENRSTNTRENMLYSKEIIDSIDPDAKVIYSTSGFHVFRSGIQARRARMSAEGIGAKTKWYFWPNAAVREFVGLISQHRLKQAIILGLMIAFFLISTYFNYMY